MSAPILRLAASQRPVFLLNSRLGPFTATPKGYSPQGYPFSLSYGVNLPSSLTRVLSTTLGLLSLPTSVGLRYGRWPPVSEAFLGSLGSAQSPRVSPPLPPLLSYSVGDGFPCLPFTSNRGRAMSTGHAQPAPLRHPAASSMTSGTGLLTRCPSPTPCGLGLGPTNPTSINVA